MIKGNHVDKVTERLRQVKVREGSFVTIDIFHDDWCKLLQGGGGDCDCAPDLGPLVDHGGITHTTKKKKDKKGLGVNDG